MRLWLSECGFDSRRSTHPTQTTEAVCLLPTTTTIPAFTPSSKRRRGFPSETRVGRGERIVHGGKELIEKLGRRDPCPCGSRRRFGDCCLGSGRYDGANRNHFFSEANRPARRPPRALWSPWSDGLRAGPGADALPLRAWPIGRGGSLPRC